MCPRRRHLPPPFIPPPPSENMWTEAQWKRARRTGRLRTEVISAVSPQRFPHSTLISSNNVSQTFQLFKKGWRLKGSGREGQDGEEYPPHTHTHTHTHTQVFHTINLSLLAVVSRKWLRWLNCIRVVSLQYIFYRIRGIVSCWKRSLSWDTSHFRGGIWNIKNWWIVWYGEE